MTGRSMPVRLVVLIAITGVHVLLVRVHGVSHPIDAHAAEVKGTGRLRRRHRSAKRRDGAQAALSAPSTGASSTWATRVRRTSDDASARP
jgi:hypothetical protein